MWKWRLCSNVREYGDAIARVLSDMLSTWRCCERGKRRDGTRCLDAMLKCESYDVKGSGDWTWRGWNGMMGCAMVEIETRSRCVPFIGWAFAFK
jgi:hypothetical protein